VCRGMATAKCLMKSSFCCQVREISGLKNPARDPPSDSTASNTSSNEAAPTCARYGVLSFALFITAISYLDRVCISMTAPFMQKDLGLTDAQVGYMFSAFTFAYAVFEVPAGWLADRFGPRLMMTRVVVWWSLFTATTGLVGGFVSLFFVRFLFGVGEAGLFPGLSRAFSRWFPGNWRGNAFGLAIMTALIGGALTQKVTAELLGTFHWHWRTIFSVYALTGLAWAVAWFWWFRDDPHRHPSVNQMELKIIGTRPPEAHPRVPWMSLLCNRSMILLCIMYFSVIYGWYFFLTWMPKYLLEARGFDLKTTGWLAMLPLLCMAAGVASAGGLSDWLMLHLGRRWGRRAPGLIGLPLASVLLAVAITTHDAKISAFLFAAAAGLATFGVAPAWAACLDIGGQHAGVVTGAMNTFGNLGGTAMPLLMGLCLEWWGSWNISLTTVALLYLVSAACWLGINSDEPIPNV
jgi:ACS family glucarate transporter-like MFS transporter